MAVMHSLALVAAFVAHAINAQIIGTRFVNNNSQPMYISMDWAAEDEVTYPGIAWQNELVQPGSQVFMQAPPNTHVKYYVGPVANDKSTVVGEQRDHNTVAEITYVGAYNLSYYDVDIEKGFSVPLWCHGENDPSDTGEGCLSDVLAACHPENRHIDEATGIYDYCIGRQTEDSLEMRQALCPDVYIQSDDHRTKTIQTGEHGEYPIFFRQHRS